MKEVCRENDTSDATYYNWKAKYGGMEVSDIKRLRELGEENQRLKRMFADLSLKHEALKDIVGKSSTAGREARARGLRPRCAQPLPERRLRDLELKSLRGSLPAETEPGSDTTLAQEV